MRNTNSHLVPIVIVLLALLFLMQAMEFISPQTVAVVWPILVGLGGISLLKEKR